MTTHKSKRIINPAFRFQTYREFMKASPELRDDADFIFQGIEKFGYKIMRITSARLKSDPLFMLKAIEATSGNAFMYAASSLKDDREFIQNALEISSIIYADLRKKWHMEFVAYGLRNPCFNFKYLPAEYRNDFNIIHQCVGSIYPLLEAQYRDDEMLCMKAIRRNPHNYRYASERLQNDPEIVMAALMRQGSLLEFLPEKLRDDDDCVFLAVSNDSSAFQYASSRLRDDDDIAAKAILDDPCNFRYASERLRDDDVLALYSMDGYGRLNYEYLSPRLRKDSKIIALKDSFTFDEGFMGCL